MSNESQSICAWGKIQTDYNTMQAVADDTFRLIEKEGYDKPKFSSPNVTNEGYSTGSVFATKSSKDRDNTEFSATERATFETLGFHAVSGFGKVGNPTTVLAPSGGDPGVYTQLFELLDIFVSNNLPCRPLASKIGEPALAANIIHDALLPAMTPQQMSFQSGDKPDLQIAASWIGSGQLTEPSGVQFYGAGKDVKEATNEHYVKKTAGTFDLYPDASFSGTPLSINCDFRGVNIVIDENLDTEGGYWCGKFQDNDKNQGMIRGSCPTKGQKVQFDFTMVLTPALKNDFALISKLKKGTPFSGKLKYIGSPIVGIHNHEATFSLTKALIAEADFVPLDGGIQGVKITTTPMAIGNVMPLSLLLKTAVPNFNTYIG